jgi:hypothetical protein
VTHQHQFLKDEKNILFLNDGKQFKYCSFDEILKIDHSFIDKIKSTVNDDVEDDLQVVKKVKSSTKIEGEKAQDSNQEIKKTGSVSLADALAFLKANGSNLAGTE